MIFIIRNFLYLPSNLLDLFITFILSYFIVNASIHLNCQTHSSGVPKSTYLRLFIKSFDHVINCQIGTGAGQNFELFMYTLKYELTNSTGFSGARGSVHQTNVS